MCIRDSPGGQPVLRNINLEVKQGDYMVILGANGSAKTTLLKIMLGLLKPQQGSLELPGPVSYTHLDVYKRQSVTTASLSIIDAKITASTRVKPWRSNPSIKLV